MEKLNGTGCLHQTNIIIIIWFNEVKNLFTSGIYTKLIQLLLCDLMK